MARSDLDLDRLGAGIDAIIADVGLSGVVRVDLDGVPAYETARGFAQRALQVPNTVGTRFGLASGAKSFTALTVMTMVERGELPLSTTARSVLGTDLPLVDDGVTVEHLLSHRSGIGDYFDEDVHTDPSAYPTAVPAQELATTEQYVRALDGHPAKFPPGERFNYCNSGFVLLAVIAERVSGVPFHDLVAERVCAPAGLHDTAFLRSDELPGRTALGYVEDDGLRTNVFHVPVRGSGDGGIYSTVADVHSLWDAFTGGRIVQPATATQMMQPVGGVPDEQLDYGLGFWVGRDGGLVSMHGFDAGVGFVSTHHLDRRCTYSVIANQSRGAWPTSERIGELLGAS